MKRALNNVAYETSYEVRYQNGAISSLDKLDNIFEGENSGSAALRLVSLWFREKTADPTVKMAVKFTDVTEASGGTAEEKVA